MNLLIPSIGFGVFVGFLFWQTWTFFRAVPAENRQYLDRPALGFRAVWPLIGALVHYGGSLVREDARLATSMRLKRGGVEYSVSADQFIAAKVVSAGFFALAAWVIGTAASFSSVALMLIGAVGGYFYPELWLREVTATRRTSILRALPFYLDIITLSVEAGSNLTGGITQAVQKSSDSPLRREFSRVLRDIRAGRTRAEALHDLVERTGSVAVQNLVGGLVQAERTGSSLGPLLRAQAEQLRNERFMAAEKQALEAPVKLLGPLVMFIFPTTFLVLIFVVLSKALEQGAITWAPLLWAYRWPGA